CDMLRTPASKCDVLRVERWRQLHLGVDLHSRLKLLAHLGCPRSHLLAGGSCHGEATSTDMCVFLRIDFPQHPARDPECLDARRNPAIDGDLNERILEIVSSHAITHGGPHVQGKLLRAIEGREHPEVHEAPVTPAERRASPSRAPAVLCYQLLEVTIEGVGLIEALAYGGLPKHFCPDFTSGHESLIHLSTPLLPQNSLCASSGQRYTARDSPPSTAIDSPVMAAARRDARNRMQSATSSTSSMRRMAAGSAASRFMIAS